MKMKEKLKFIFNELKSIILNELLIINSSFMNVKTSNNFILKSIKWNHDLNRSKHEKYEFFDE